MSSLFLAWQDPQDRRWLPVGKLTFDGARYQFAYTRGAMESPRFLPFGKMTKLDVVHESDELFPLFANRLLSESRSEYRGFLRCLNVPDDKDDPMVLLARSGGRRETDTLEVFPCPEPTDTGQYHVHFFVHGIRHLPGAARRIEDLHPGDRLFVMRDVQNSHDPLALTLRTDDPCVLIGYCPRYLASDLLSLLEECDDGHGERHG